MERFQNKELVQSYLEMHNKLHSLFEEFNFEEIQLYRFHKGEMIYITGEEISNMYFIVEGKVKIYTTTIDDKRLILRFQKALGVIGDIEFIHNDPALHSVEASSDCTALGIPYRTIREKVKQNPVFLQYLLEAVTQKFRTKTSSSNNLLYPVEVRFASYLLSTVEGNESVAEAEDLSLTEVSELIGTSYRHLNRVIQKLSNEETIKREKGIIHITDLDKLREIAKGNIYE
ncbi:MAG: Crp/Fnr family transcriptional regulator [Bacillus sp. (in: firmicutes)]